MGIENPAYNFEVMSRDIHALLIEVMESDGVIDEREDLVLERVDGIFAEAGRKSFGATLVGIKGGLTAKPRSERESLIQVPTYLPHLPRHQSM